MLQTGRGKGQNVSNTLMCSLFVNLKLEMYEAVLSTDRHTWIDV